MKRLSFLEKTRELSLYTDRYETVTLFELTQLYGSALCAFLVFLLSIPLLVFSTQWVVLPVGFVCILLSTLLLFNEHLWLFDAHKAITITSPTLKKIAGWMTVPLEWLDYLMPEAPFYEQYYAFFRRVNPLVLIIAAFQVGFIQSPDTSYFTVFSLLLVSLGSFTDDGYFCLAGYAAFLIGII